jgi:hypothetical protein
MNELELADSHVMTLLIMRRMEVCAPWIFNISKAYSVMASITEAPKLLWYHITAIWRLKPKIMMAMNDNRRLRV